MSKPALKAAMAPAASPAVRRRTTLRSVGDFLFGLAVFSLLAGFYAPGTSAAFPGAVAPPPSIAAITHPGSADGGTVPGAATAHLVPATFLLDRPAKTANAALPITAPGHPLNTALFGLVFAFLTAMNLAFLRHVRASYVLAKRGRNR